MDHSRLTSRLFLALAFLLATCHQEALAYDITTLGASASACIPHRPSEVNTGLYSDATQTIGFATGGRTQAKIIHTATSSNYVTLTGSNGNDPAIAVDGGSTNPGLTLSSKGSGSVTILGEAGTITLGKFVVSSATGVNYPQFANAATGLGPSVTATGTDTDISLGLISKNAGSLNLQTGGGRQARVTDTASAVNYVNLTGAATGSGPTVTVNGTDSSADLNLLPKAGKVSTGNFYVVTAGNKRVATQVDKTTSTSLSTLTDLSATIYNGKTYSFRAVLHVTADATGGHKYDVTTGSGAATAIIYEIKSTCNTTNLNVITARQTTLAATSGQAGCTDPFTEISGTITSSSDTSLQIQFAQNAATGTSSVLVGSFMTVWQEN